MITRLRTLWLAVVLGLSAPSVFAQSPSISAPLTTTTCPGSGCLALNVQGLTYTAVQVNGSFTGTLTFEASIDGVTYTALAMTPSGGGSAVTTATAAGLWNAAIGGYGQVRVRFSSYMSGTATVFIQGAR